MLVYTVTKPVGTKDKEFEAYTRLLEEVGIDVSNSPRVPEPGTDSGVGGHPRFLGTREWVAPNADHGFHQLFKYLMFA